MLPRPLRFRTGKRRRTDVQRGRRHQTHSANRQQLVRGRSARRVGLLPSLLRGSDCQSLDSRHVDIIRRFLILSVRRIKLVRRLNHGIVTHSFATSDFRSALRPDWHGRSNGGSSYLKSAARRSPRLHSKQAWFVNGCAAPDLGRSDFSNRGGFDKEKRVGLWMSFRTADHYRFIGSYPTKNRCIFSVRNSPFAYLRW